MDQLDVLGEVLLRETRQVASHVVFGKVVAALDLAGQEAAAERRVCYDGNPQLAASLQDTIVLDLSGPERILDLDGADFRHLGCTADRISTALAERNAAQFASLNILVHRANSDFNRRLRVHASTLEEIQLLRASQLRQALVDTPADILWTTIRLHATLDQAALDGEDDFLGVAGVLLEVLAQEVKGVAFGSAVELAAVPEVGAVI